MQWDLSNDALAKPSVPWLTVASGATVTIEGVAIGNGPNAAAQILDSGSLNLFADGLSGAEQDSIDTGSGAYLNMVDSYIDSQTRYGVNAALGSHVTLTNDDLVYGNSYGLAYANGTSTSVNNVLLAKNHGGNCHKISGSSNPTFDSVITDDTSCTGNTGADNDNSALLADEAISAPQTLGPAPTAVPGTPSNCRADRRRRSRRSSAWSFPAIRRSARRRTAGSSRTLRPVAGSAATSVT